MRKKLFLLVLALHFLIFNFLFAQQNIIDSLQKILLTAKNDSNKVKTLNKLSSQYFDIADYKKTLLYADSALTLAKKINYKKGIASATSNMGLVYENTGNYAKALEHYFASLKQFEEIGNKRGISYALNNIGGIYYHQKNFSEALNKFEESLKIKEELGSDKSEISSAYNNIGLIYEQQEKFDSALEKHLISLKLNQEIQDRQGISYSLQNIANIYSKKNETLKAMNNLLEALKISKEINDQLSTANCLLNLGGLHIVLKKFYDSEKYIHEGLSISKKINYTEGVLNGYKGLSELYDSLKQSAKALENYKSYFQLRDSILNDETSTKIANLQNQYYAEKEEKIRQLEEEKKEALAKQEKELTELKQFWTEIICGIVFLSLISIAYIQYKKYKAKKKTSEELAEKNSVIAEQKRMVEEKNKDITDSINYAQRIQKTLLASDDLLKKNLKEYFVFFRPKDIVSGDFYWATEKNGKFFLAVCDSTGHGIPGAFMSLLNISFLNEAINKEVEKPNEIFNHVRKRLIENISTDGAKDGMDGILLCIAQTPLPNGMGLEYAAANNAPVFVNDSFHELNFDKMPVGFGEKTNSFALHTLQANGIIYLYTDGFADQFGGPKGKKFKYKQLNEKLHFISEKPLHEQKLLIEKIFNDWKGNIEQVDDVLIIGLRV